MKRRSRAGDKPAEPRRRKTVTPKRRNAPKAVPRGGSSAAGQEAGVARFTQEGANTDIGGWLRSLGLERYEGAFRENEIEAIAEISLIPVGAQAERG